MFNFIRTAFHALFITLALIFTLLVSVGALIANAVYKSILFVANNILVIISVVIIATFGFAMVVPRDPNFISQDDPAHPINAVLE